MLDDRGETPLVVLVAPAGSGKTTLLLQWAAAFDGPLAWIDAVDDHNDPAVLVPEFIAAIAEVAPDIRDGLLAIVPGPGAPITTRVLPLLVRTLRGAAEPFALVIDDVHVITEPAAAEVIEAVAENLPPGSRMLIGTRFAPALRLSSLVSKRIAVEIGPDDLAVRPDEAGLVLDAAGLPVGDAAARVLADRTEGWAAGMILGAMAVRGADDRTAAAAAFGGGERHVTDWFSEEVLSDLDEAEIDLLEAAAVLVEANAEGCSAVLDRQVSVEDLRALAHAHTFLMPVDEDGGRFRLHGLFGEMLRAELWGRDRRRAATLQMRAAHWCLECGDHVGGVRHLIWGGDVEGAAVIVMRLVPPLQTRGRRTTLRRIIELFDPDDVHARPPLAIAAAWSAAESGSHMVGHWIRAAEAGLAAADPDAPGTAEIRANLLLLRAAACPDGAVRMVADAYQAYQAYPDESPWRTAACLFLGVAQYVVGDTAAGGRTLRECVERAGDAMPTMGVLAGSSIAGLALLEDRTVAAERAVAPARSLVQRHDLQDYSTTFILDAAEALLAVQRGDPETSRRLQLSSRAKLPRTADIAPWGQVLARVLLARAALRSGGDETARTLGDEAAEFLARIPDAPVLDAALRSFREAVDGIPRGGVAGPGSLTTAELRVLRFMPTHLTYKEMGERLHVSRFTVKSQAQAVYRKLGVTTRSDAVARGRALGLLDL